MRWYWRMSRLVGQHGKLSISAREPWISGHGKLAEASTEDGSGFFFGTLLPNPSHFMIPIINSFSRHSSKLELAFFLSFSCYRQVPIHTILFFLLASSGLPKTRLTPSTLRCKENTQIQLQFIANTPATRHIAVCRNERQLEPR